MPDLDALFRPRSVVLVGASPDTAIIRGRMVKAMAECGFAGPVFCVSRSHTDIGGFPTYPEIEALPEPVDLALITVPAAFVADALESCGRRGIRAAVIISSGFAEERSAEGLARQAAVSAAARAHDMAVIGPNGEGFLNSALPITATFSPAVLNSDLDLLPARSRSGGIAVVSHSGGIGFSIYNRGRPSELRFSYVISMGNEAGVDSLDVVDFLIDDPDTDVITMFIEGLKQPDRLAAVATRAAEAGKPIVVAKMGRSEAGAAAVASHTASLAGSHRTYRSVFDRYGIIHADDLDELVDLSAAFAYFRACLPRGRRMAVLTPSGGAGIWLADSCATAGLEVGELDAATRAAIDEHLPPYGSSRNPVDLTAQALDALGYARTVEILAASPEVDGVMVACSLISPRHIEADEARLHALRESLDKPVIFCPYTEAHPRAVEILAAAGFPCFTSAPNGARAMAELVRYGEFRERLAAARPAAPTASSDTIGSDLRAGPFTEQRSKALLAAHGVIIATGALVRSPEEAAAYVAKSPGTYACKVQSPSIAHKTEAGGVALGIATAEEARAAYAAVVAAAQRFAPDATIEGVLIEPMAPPGVEMIVGVTTDPEFGQLLLVGTGGVLVEVLDDVALSPVPLNRGEAERMVDSLAGAALLAGVRGAPPADRDALVALMVEVSTFAAAAGDALSQLDLNPVIVHAAGAGLTVADALVVGS
jgi:acyl-CoA synthetase (NDP forming)